MIQALRDIEAHMERPGSRGKSDLQKGIRSYHLRFSREGARTALGIVQKTRHFVIYRRRQGQSVIDILRIRRFAPRDSPRKLRDILKVSLTFGRMSYTASQI
jgi:hypothetical protein